MFIFAIFIIILSFASCSDLNDNPIDIPDGDRYEDIVFDEYTLTRNIKYGSNVSMSGSQIDLKLDLYEPKGDTVEERPLVILAPGGAFQYLSNLDMNNIAEKLTSYGYVCAVISYRILDNSSITEQTYLDVAIKARADLKAAIRFFVKDADGDQKYRINTDNLFVGGQHVTFRGWTVDIIVHQDGNVFLLESVNLHDVLFHVQDIVVATR